jgi:hypothetical protein
MKVGEEFRVKFPFKISEYHKYDESGYEIWETWVPGCRAEPVHPDSSEFVADGEGEMILTIVDIHKPGKYPERVFYTRRWIDPDGKGFGTTKLHITTTPTFKRRAAGYYHKYLLK